MNMRRGSLLLLALIGSLIALAPAMARTVTDQLNRTVTVPDHVERIVVLQHQTLDILVELGAADRIVGVLRTWQKLIPGLDKYAPQLTSLPTPGDLSTVNVEEVLKLKPDVVFVTNYAPPAMIDQLAQAGLPVVAISLSKGEGVEALKLNPTFADDDVAYSEGLKIGVRLIGDIVGKRERADQLIDYAFAQRKLVEERVASIPDAERVKLYMANPDMNTYGSGKYTGVIMKRSGGINVAAGVRGATKVSMEDVLAWNHGSSSCRIATRRWPTRSGRAPPGSMSTRWRTSGCTSRPNM